jgi:hypothetical protein
MALSNSAKASTICIRTNLIKLAERLVDIVNEYEGLGGMEAELLKNEFLAQLRTDLGPFLTASP